MGPRLHSRGYLLWRWQTYREPIRFNGAAASQPRIPAESCRYDDKPEGFNGAAASQPRILVFLS